MFLQVYIEHDCDAPSNAAADGRVKARAFLFELITGQCGSLFFSKRKAGSPNRITITPTAKPFRAKPGMLSVERDNDLEILIEYIHTFRIDLAGGKGKKN